MNRNFVLPALIALALHAGVVFALPRGPAPKPVPKPQPPKEVIQVIATVPPEPDVPDPTPMSEPTEAAAASLTPVSADVAVTNTGGFEQQIRDLLPRHGTPSPVVGPVTIGIPDGIGSGPVGILSSIHLDDAPRTRVQVRPMYPAGAKSQGREGEVLVEFTVDEAGRVLNPRVVRSSDAVFEEPTLRAVTRWRFEPGRRHGQIVRFKMAVPVVFSLAN